MKKTIVFTAALLLCSCSPFSTPVSELSVEELAARVPAYDDATPVRCYGLPDIKTIGELRRALANGLDPNGCHEGRRWHMSYGSTYAAQKEFSQEELMRQRLAKLDVMLRAGGDPQKAIPCGDEEEHGIAYALLIRHGLRADEPHPLTPETLKEDGYRWESYPLNGLSTLPPTIITWLVENGAPLNERFCGETELMNLYEGIWSTLVKKRFSSDGEVDSTPCWERAYAVTEQLLALGVDLSVESKAGFYAFSGAEGYCAIDYIPLAGKATDELREHYAEDDFRQAQRLRELLLAHGSPERRADGNFGETGVLLAQGHMSVYIDHEDLEEASRTFRERANAERAEREARMRPLRAARRAAKAAEAPQP